MFWGGGESCEGFIMHSPFRPHPRIRLALPPSGVDLASKYVDQKPVALVQKRVALVQNRAALVQETPGRPFLQLVKTPFAPSPNHFGQF